MMTSEEQIYQSPGYLNVVEAMDHVFGNSNWSASQIWPGGNANDYQMAVDVDGKSRSAYISVGDTHLTGMYAFGPGGRVAISVPNPEGIFVYPDRVRGDAITQFYGTEEEKWDFRWGASGLNIPQIERYLQILKRYLDGQESENTNTHNAQGV